MKPPSNPERKLPIIDPATLNRINELACKINACNQQLLAMISAGESLDRTIEDLSQERLRLLYP